MLKFDESDPWRRFIEVDNKRSACYTCKHRDDNKFPHPLIQQPPLRNERFSNGCCPTYRREDLAGCRGLQ